MPKRCQKFRNCQNSTIGHNHIGHLDVVQIRKIQNDLPAIGKIENYFAICSVNTGILKTLLQDDVLSWNAIHDQYFSGLRNRDGLPAVLCCLCHGVLHVLILIKNFLALSMLISSFEYHRSSMKPYRQGMIYQGIMTRWITTYNTR